MLGEPDEMFELFRAEGRERYLAAGQTLKFPRNGFFLDEMPGEIKFIVIAAPQADKPLQEIIQRLPDSGMSQDKALIGRFRQRLLELPENAIHRLELTQQ